MHDIRVSWNSVRKMGEQWQKKSKNNNNSNNYNDTHSNADGQLTYYSLLKYFSHK